jgi:pilus assembly protein Flp/PilA
MPGAVFKIFGDFKDDRSGVTGLEYALLTALVSVAILTGANMLGTRAGGTFSDAAGKFQSASSSSSPVGALGNAPSSAVAITHGP